MNIKKINRGIILSAICLQISACASIVSGSSESLSVETKYKNKPVTAAKCKLSNDKGTWFVTTPGSVTVYRSFEALQINCEKDKFPSGNLNLDSRTKPLAFGNILFGGVIGGAVDIGSGAAYDYPTLITVAMGENRTITAGPVQPPTN